MLSRTAEDLYWMARNMERAENTARHARGQLSHVDASIVDGSRSRVSTDLGDRAR